MSGEFVDTNILVYAHDAGAGRKREIASSLLLRLLEEKSGRLSVQVLMEFYTTVTKKIAAPLSSGKASEIVSDLTTWQAYAPVAMDVLKAIEISEGYKISFWDAMIVRAASALGASVIWSEDLKDGRVYEGVIVKNPFL